MAKVEYTEYDGGGYIMSAGWATPKVLQTYIAERGNEAAEIVRAADGRIKHYVYAAKWYNPGGELEKVTFYAKPADEVEFDRIAELKNCIVYAIHSHM